MVSTDQVRRQGLDDCVHRLPDMQEVVQHLDQVVYLHWLKGRADLAGALDHLHLVPGQAVAGHAIRVVGQFDLDVFIDAKVVVADVLVEDFSGRRGEFCEFHRFASRFLRICRDLPVSLPLNRSWNLSFFAISANHLC